MLGTRQSLAELAWADVLLALILAALALVEIWVEPIFQTGLPGPRGAMSALALLAVVPVAWRRSHPLAALLTVTAGGLGLAVAGDRDQASFEVVLALLAVVYSVAAHATARRALAGLLVTVAGAVAIEALTFAPADTPVDALVPSLFLLAAYALGTEVRRHREEAAAAGARALAATTDERARIARELHDAVAHSVGVMVVHLGAARLRAAGVPDVQPHLRAAEASGREALAEMRRMVGLLREDAGGGLDPVPSLEHLDALAARMRAAGLDVDLATSGTARRLAPGIDLCAYRIVQEGMTNALKHGSGSVRVRLHHEPDALAIQLRSPLARAGAGPDGHGLVGMRERARVVGGELRAGAHAGEWVVDARLPLAGAQ